MQQPEIFTLGDVMDVLWGFVIFDVAFVAVIFYLLIAGIRKRDGDQ